MSEIPRDQPNARIRVPVPVRRSSMRDTEQYDDGFVHAHPPACEIGIDHHCLTCSDEAMPVKVLQVNQEAGLALVAVHDQAEEIDVTLVEDVVPGDTLLVHGGVAIARVYEVNDDQ